MDNNSLNCGHSHCGACCGGSCREELELTPAAVDLLQLFAQRPFLPLVLRHGAEQPLFPDDNSGAADQLGAAITELQLKQLIKLDYDLPLLNYDYSAYGPSARRGSMALTARGQAVLELAEIQGIHA